MTDPLLARQQEIEALGAAWSSMTRAQRRPAAVLEYYCRQRGCALLTCFQTPNGLFVWLPQYRTSPEKNAKSSAATARASRTLDGARRWKPRVVSIDDVADPALPDQMGAMLKCDHLDRFLTGRSLLADLSAGKPGRPYVVRV